MTNKLRHPKQPTFIYNIEKSWDDVIRLKPIWKSHNFPKLPKSKKYQFLGFDLISPIIIAAGPSTGKLWSDFYFKMGYGGVIEKTKRSTPRPSNKAPNIAIIQSETPITRQTVGKPVSATMNQSEFAKYQSITNSFGNPSSTIQEWSSQLPLQLKARSNGQILGCSVTATFPEDGPSCFKLLKTKDESAAIVETTLDLLVAASAAVVNGAQFIEFNLACPNVTENSEEGEMFQNPKLLSYLFAEFKKRFPHTPVGFKFGLYKNKTQMQKCFSAAGNNLDYVSGVNAISTPVSDSQGQEILPGRKSSGVCGKIMKHIALEETQWAAEIRTKEGLKYQILAGGGIITPQDANEFLSAGANAVQVATIALTNPLLAHEYTLSQKN